MRKRVYWVGAKAMLTAEIPADSVSMAVGAPCPEHAHSFVKAIDYDAKAYWCANPERTARGAYAHALPKLMHTTTRDGRVEVFDCEHTVEMIKGFPP